jgi:hypothetical protein
MSADTNNHPWLTQKELASRWKVAQSSIVNWRKNGKIPFFPIPGSSRILYSLESIIELERKHTTTTKEEQGEQKEHTELKRKKPVVSAKPFKEWRI